MHTAWAVGDGAIFT